MRSTRVVCVPTNFMDEVEIYSIFKMDTEGEADT